MKKFKTDQSNFKRSEEYLGTLGLFFIPILHLRNRLFLGIDVTLSYLLCYLLIC